MESDLMVDVYIAEIEILRKRVRELEEQLRNNEYKGGDNDAYYVEW